MIRIATGLIIFIFTAVVRLTNPQLTETELLLAYWPLWLLLAAIGLFAIFADSGGNGESHD